MLKLDEALASDIKNQSSRLTYIIIIDLYIAYFC